MFSTRLAQNYGRKDNREREGGRWGLERNGLIDS